MSYYSGAGNTFFIIDNRKQLEKDTKEHIQIISKNTDGVIFLEKGKKTPLAMRIFNRDGGEAEMCGNGLRCLFSFAQKLGIVEDKALFETKGGFFEVFEENEKNEKKIVTTYAFPKKSPVLHTFQLHGRPLCGHFVEVGVPHFLIRVKEIEEAPLDRFGRKIRHHPLFGKKGTNVNFFEIKKADEEGCLIYNRTYERGVEAATQSCGTGAIAISSLFKYLNYTFPLTIIVQSGDSFTISYKKDKFLLAGPVREILY